MRSRIILADSRVYPCQFFYKIMGTNLLPVDHLRNTQRHKMLKKCLKLSVEQLVNLLFNEIDQKNKVYDFIIIKGLVAEFRDYSK